MGTTLFLGVEGSGKTVLNMALAKVFAAHPEAGFRLRPENRAAFRFLEQLPASLYATPQPPEQPGRYASVAWSVCRGQDAVLSLDIPECPGELFRLAFQKPGDAADPADFAARAAERGDDIKQLLAQVASASRVYVLFDVSRIRDTDKDPGRLDAVWATNACLRHLLSLDYPPQVFLLLTHADRDPAAGNDFRAILRDRLPVLADNYPDLPGLAVSSVKPYDPDFGLQPLLFQLLSDAEPLAGLLASALKIWNTVAGPGDGEAPPDALREAASQLDALRAQAPWFAQGPHALGLAPGLAEELRRLADEPPADGGIRKALADAFPALAAHAAAVAAAPKAKPRPDVAAASPAAPAVKPVASSSKHSSEDTSSSLQHRHHHRHHHHGGRRTPTRRFFDKIVRYLPWALATVILALAFTYGIPFAKRSWGQHCMDRGLRLAASRPEAAFRAFTSARKFKAPGSDIALMACRQAGIGCAVDPDAAAAAFAKCRWTYSAPQNAIIVQRLVKNFQRMADAQDANAQYLLGRMHEEGKGVPQDPAEAFRRMEQAATRGQPQALQWMIAKALGGNADAQIFLGRLYLDGDGPAGHEAESIRWVLLAAKDRAPDARAWLAAQAEAGNAAAQYTLGRQAELRARKTGGGLGPAIDWYRKAAELGNPDARAALERLAP